MSENRRVTSSARRIKHAWLWRLLRLYFWLDVVLALSLACGFMLYNERAALGDAWSLNLERTLRVGEGDSLWMRLHEGAYAFATPDGVWHTAPLCEYVETVTPFATAILCFEALSLARQLLFGGRWARKLLKPLDDMARATRELLEKQENYRGAPPLDDEKLHDLEDRIKAMRPEETLTTGDRDLRGLEEAVNSLLRRLHESYRRQGQFVSDASHELRTPIAVIQGYAAMLDRWGKSDEKILEESIAAIKSESEYMKKLVEQLLFLARGDMGTSRLEMRRVDVGELVKEVYEDATLIDRSHDWRLQIQPEVFVTADRDMLKQCLRVFCDNAAKYTPAGGMICLRVQGGADVRIQVQDSGIGIAREDVSRVFDRFYRSDPARDRNSGGTGLGLSIARWIVESHAGHIEVLSRQDIGTRFTVVLPPEKPA